MILFFMLLSGVSANLQRVDSEIASLSSTLENYRRTRDLLLSPDYVPEPSYLLPVNEPLLPSAWLFNRIIPKLHWTSHQKIVLVELVPIKPIGHYRDVVNGANLAIGVVLENSDFELYEPNGTLLFRLKLGFAPRILAATSHYDEIKLAFVTQENHIKIYQINMERPKKEFSVKQEYYGLQSNKTSIEMTLESDAPCEFEINSIIFYMKTGKKYWVTGDARGGIGLHLFNGTQSKRLDTGKGNIVALDRFGHILAFGSERGVGTIATQTMSIQQFCESVLST